MGENCFDNCPYKDTIADLKKANENNRDDITEIKLSQKEMQGDMKIIQSDVSHMVDLLKTVQSFTEEIKSKPSKTANAVAVAAISGTATAVIVALVFALIKLL